MSEEKKNEIRDERLEDVSGGSLPSHAANDSDYIEDEAMLIIPIV